ncbi:acyltransferase [Anaerobacillus sp. CMMVII]|uniref:acyltransferase n=1 Tax=Anaerobacillus sp. CMMVII TaxID=2755588 RepID=UPI0021B7AEE6|nr:acyltransferase [Anaerobacillus sp. CMMVII]MCT8137702.1 acyltransferase [Anaerobacillus sp. CMMVII]
MYFHYLLDATLGPRVIYYVIECSVCGFDEVYFKSPESGELLGRACANCNCFQKFDFDKNVGKKTQLHHKCS